MHGSVMRWVEAMVQNHGLANHSTLEVGSYDVNGSVRCFFTGHYIGVDLTEGPGVDYVMDAEHLHWPDDEWDVVVSTEMLEHCEDPFAAVNEMARVCKSGGWVLVTARGFDEERHFAYHEHPNDVWRLGPPAMGILAKRAGLEVVDVVKDPEAAGWFLAARRPQ